MRHLAAILAAALTLFSLGAVARTPERAPGPARADTHDDVAYAVRWWHEWRRRGLIRGKVIRKLRARLHEQAARRRVTVFRAPSRSGQFLATGYAPGCGDSGRTATGTRPGPGTIAVDPAQISLGTRMYVAGYGNGTALDTGGSIGWYRVDLWFPTCSQANAWGKRTVAVRW